MRPHSIFFQFHAFFGKNGKNNGLMPRPRPPVRAILDPPLSSSTSNAHSSSINRMLAPKVDGSIAKADYTAEIFERFILSNLLFCTLHSVLAFILSIHH